MQDPSFDPRTPVLVGIGLVSQREEDPREACEPLVLMIDATRRAGEDTGVPQVLTTVRRVCVPHGRWRYGDPGRAIAKAIGAPSARTLISRVGVLQQTLIGDTCRRIATGEEDSVLVVGGDAGYRILRGGILGIPIEDTPDNGVPDEVLEPDAPLRAKAELAVGLTMPVGLYAIIETALRASRGEGVWEHRDRIAALYAHQSRIAAENPHAWSRTAFGPEEIRDPSPQNPMQAFPYTRRHCSSWSVDQASALLIMSAEKAAASGISRGKWVFALASSESNRMLTVSSRRELHRSPGARIAGRAALDTAGLEINAINFIDLYSCFPSAIQICATELAVPPGRDLTVTGGMAFAGGPYNNYVLHSTGQMGQILRRNPSTKGLVGSISGVVTKQGFGIWSQSPVADEFDHKDATGEVAAATPPVEVTEGHHGAGRVVGYTVLHTKDAAPRGILLADTEQGQRAVAQTDDPALVQIMEERELVGSTVSLAGFEFRLA